jgi:hypothetical protein
MHDALFRKIQVSTDLQCFPQRIHFLPSTILCDDVDPLLRCCGHALCPEHMLRIEQKRCMNRFAGNPCSVGYTSPPQYLLHFTIEKICRKKSQAVHSCGVGVRCFSQHKRNDLWL